MECVGEQVEGDVVLPGELLVEGPREDVPPLSSLPLEDGEELEVVPSLGVAGQAGERQRCVGIEGVYVHRLGHNHQLIGIDTALGK